MGRGGGTRAGIYLQAQHRGAEGSGGKPFDVPKLPVTTTSTENTIKLVTEASSAVVGQERRDGYVKGGAQSGGDAGLQDQERHHDDILVTFTGLMVLDWN